jgi:ankyrin repeat protein
MCSGANEIFKYLLTQGAIVNVETLTGVSILHQAAIDDNTYILTYLRDKCNFNIH